LDTCFNRTQTFLDPIYVQISLNNGILWQTLMTINYRREPWLIEFSNDETIKLHFVRIRLFQRVTTRMLNKIELFFYVYKINFLEWISNWILNKFEIIPEKLPDRLISHHFSLINTCNYKYKKIKIEFF